MPIASWVNIGTLLASVPPLTIYLLVGLIVGVESLGIPLPGEVVLAGAALLSAHPDLHISPLWVAIAAILGASIGDSTGYAIGHRYGRQVFTALGRRFPKHINDDTVAYGEHVFARFGALAVFFGRFVALLRILAGPIAGMLRMPYLRFGLTNVSAAVCWAGGMTALLYFLGTAAERWLKDFAWVALVVVVVVGVVGTLLLRRRIADDLAAFTATRHRAGG